MVRLGHQSRIKAGPVIVFQCFGGSADPCPQFGMTERKLVADTGRPGDRRDCDRLASSDEPLKGPLAPSDAARRIYLTRPAEYVSGSVSEALIRRELVRLPAGAS